MADSNQKPKDAPPTSRLGRLARLAGLAPRALPFAMEGAKRAFRSRGERCVVVPSMVARVGGSRMTQA